MAIKNQTARKSFSSIKVVKDYPDFLDIQLQSFKDFFQLDTPAEKRRADGLFKVFAENFPISDSRENFTLEFIDYAVDPPKYSVEECIDRGLTYSVPLKAKLRLLCHDEDNEDFETIEQEVFLGNLPYMTEKGSFVINGAERVIVSQLHRSPGVFFAQSKHTNGTKLYSARIIPFKGSWIEFATDINNVMYAYIDRKKKFPVTTLLRAIGYGSDKDILDLFGLSEEVPATKSALKKAAGRKLAARVLRSWVEDFVDEDTGEVVSIDRNEVLLERDTVLTDEDIEMILDSGSKSIILHREDVNVADFSIIYNTLQKDNSNSEKEAVEVIYRQLRNTEAPDEATAREVIQSLFFSDKRYDLVIEVEADELAMDIPFDEFLMVLDIRTEEQYNQGHIKNSIHLPLLEFADPGSMSELDEHFNIYIISEDGEANTLAASILKKQGIHNNRIVKGGWQSILQLKDKFTIEVTKEKKTNDPLDAI